MDHKAEALKELGELQVEVARCIDEVHVQGFELTQISRRLDYLKALLEERSDLQIIEFRDRIRAMRMHHDENKGE